MAKRIYITESQFDIIREMAYPESFSMQQLLSLKSYAARLRYCENRLEKIGQGSSRVVYAIDSEKVLKVAKNKKGIAQNELESEDWLQGYACFAEVYERSDDGIYLEMQAARRAKKSDFKRLTGYDFETFVAWIYYVKSWYTRSQYGVNSGWYSKYLPLFKSEKFQEGLDNYNLFNQIESYLCDTCLESVGDLTRISSWGIVNSEGEEKLVIIDFGLNDDIYSEYYSPKR